MAVLWFLVAMLGLVVFAVVVNRVTDTKALYLETLELTPDERELWRDNSADFVTVPKLGRTRLMTFQRWRRHSVVWTDRRVIVAPKVLLSSKHMVTHQLFFPTNTGFIAADAREAAGAFFSGFYGRGFLTVVGATKSFEHVDGKGCVRITPSPESGESLNIDEAYVFSDHLRDLEDALSRVSSSPGARA